MFPMNWNIQKHPDGGVIDSYVEKGLKQKRERQGGRGKMKAQHHVRYDEISKL